MRKNQLERVMNMLKNDRSVTADNFTKLVKIDLINLLSDYFDCVNDLQINVEKTGEKISAIISFNAEKVKIFTSLPDANLL